MNGNIFFSVLHENENFLLLLQVGVVSGRFQRLFFKGTELRRIDKRCPHLLFRVHVVRSTFPMIQFAGILVLVRRTSALPFAWRPLTCPALTCPTLVRPNDS